MFGNDTNPGAENQSGDPAAGFDSSDVAGILKEAAEMAQVEDEGGQSEDDLGDEDHLEDAASAEDDAGTDSVEGDDELDGEIPDEYAERWKKMEAAHTRRSQELAELRKQTEADRARLREVLERLDNRTVPSGDDPSRQGAEPQPPGENATHADWVEYNKKLQLWAAEQVYSQKHAQDPDIAAIRQQRALAERSAQIESHLQGHDGYSPEVADTMTRIVHEQPALQRLVWGEGEDFSGVDYIYNLAVKEVAAKNAAKKAAETKRRQAKAAKSAGTRPSDARGGKPVPDEELSGEDALLAEARRLAGF